VCLVDGTITPCWSYEDHHELWSRKHGTTGFNAQLLCLLNGDVIYISDPLPGCTYDAKAFATTPVAEIVRHSGGGIGDKGYQGCDIITPRKTPPGGELSIGDKANNTVISALRTLSSVMRSPDATDPTWLYQRGAAVPLYVMKSSHGETQEAT
jgi:hypothetical protein